MSFILDALKKSETDRQRQSSPALFEVKVAAPKRRLPVWAIALAALLAVNVAVLAWVLLRSPSASPTQPLAAASAAAAPTAAQTADPSRMVTVTMPADSSSTVTLSPNHTAGQPEPGVVGPSPAPPLAEDPLLAGGETPIPPNYDANDYAPAVSVAQANDAAAKRAGVVPSRDEVIAQGAQLPDLRLDLHVYAIKPADRFVFINMRKLREGESLPDGVRVELITPSGVQLDYRGKRFVLEGN